MNNIYNIVKTKFSVGILSGLLLFTYANSAYSQLLIVSDIDDTIKVSHGGDSADVVRRMYKTKPVFLGMAKLLNDTLASNTRSQIFYLTNAPKQLLKRAHTKLIKDGGFPLAKIYFRNANAKDHKIKVLRNLIEEVNPSRVILIGDNADKDMIYYSKITNEYQSIDFVQFIRLAYDKRSTLALKPGQLGFVSGVDIAIELNAQGLLDGDMAINYIGSEIPKLLKYKKERRFDPEYLPSWVKCPNFHVPSFGNDLNELSNLVRTYELAMHKYCNI